MRTVDYIRIGARWAAKRGRRLPGVTIRQVHRADRQVVIETTSGTRERITWSELRAGWKPEATA